MSLLNISPQNKWPKKLRTLLIVYALGFSIAAIVSVYAYVDVLTSDTQATTGWIVVGTEGMTYSTTSEYNVLIVNAQQSIVMLEISRYPTVTNSTYELITPLNPPEIGWYYCDYSEYDIVISASSYLLA